MRPLNRPQRNFCVLWLCLFLVVFQCRWKQTDTYMNQTEWRDHLCHWEWQNFSNWGTSEMCKVKSVCEGQFLAESWFCLVLDWNGEVITLIFAHVESLPKLCWGKRWPFFFFSLAKLSWNVECRIFRAERGQRLRCKNRHVILLEHIIELWHL